MRRGWRIATFSFLLFLASLLGAYPLCAQQNQLGKIVGTIRVVKGDFPAHPVLISLAMRGSPIGSAYCDDQGRFGFYNLIANQYQVSIDDDAYEPVSETLEVNPQNSPMNFLDVRLVPRADTKQPAPLKRLQGSNPYLIDPSEYKHHFPKKAVKEFEKGVAAERKGKIDDAIGHYEKAISLAPEFYPAHNNLGSLYLSRQNFPAAQAEFEAALKTNQNDSQAHFNLANVLLLTQNYDAAQHQIEEGLQRQPDSAFGQFLQGSLYAHTGQPKLAEKSLQTALQFDPLMSQVYLQLVNLYLQEKRTSDAIAELEAYLKAFPDTAFSPKARDLLKRLQAGDSTPSH